jgi:GAF domain-containing protein
MVHEPTTGTDLPLTDELAAVFARMSGLLLGEDTVETALSVLSALAHETVPGSTGAGVTVIDQRGRRVSWGSTDDEVLSADGLQYDLDEGPCLEAATTRQVVRVDDLTSDPRWPRWAGAAAEAGLRATLSAPLVAGERSLGAIKVYSDRVGAFDDRAQHRLSLFAGQAALLVANVQTAERAKRLSESLREAFRSRDVVSLAKGVLMGRDGLSEEVAFRVLLSRAREHGETVRDAAQSVVTSAVRWRR